jgi:hypothetical protein
VPVSSLQRKRREHEKEPHDAFVGGGLVEGQAREVEVEARAAQPRTQRRDLRHLAPKQQLRATDQLRYFSSRTATSEAGACLVAGGHRLDGKDEADLVALCVRCHGVQARHQIRCRQ